MKRIIGLVLICLFAPPVGAQSQIPWKQGNYFRGQAIDDPTPLKELFEEFGKVQEIPVIVSQDVAGAISVQHSAMPPEKYLDTLCADNDLIWYFDGAAIHIYTDAALQSAALPLGSLTDQQLVEALQRLGVYSARFPIRAEPELGMIFVSGPARYLEVIDQILKGADKQVRNQARVDVAFEIIPLRYAWASDQTFVVSGSQVSVPGVATLLRAIVGDQASSVGISVQQLPQNRPSLNGFGLIQPQNLALANAQQAAIEARVAAAGAQAQARAAAAANQAKAESAMEAQVQGVIQADPGTNSILIKDVRRRIETYKQIIQQLDRPRKLVQIKANLIDINADSGFQFGLPYNALWRRNGVQHSFGANLATSNVANLEVDPGNLTISFTRGEVTEFLANMRALESKGDATLVSKPSVVTIDNIEAFLEETEEFYVRVEGFEQVDLFNVTIGTKLQILPHIIEETGGRRVKLNVRIEDGSRSATAEVDEIPVVARNTLTTQAVLMEGQSLLIGGLMREQETKTVRGIPVLSRIPKVGLLFRETVQDVERMERLVLLTPTIIDLPRFQVAPHCPGPLELLPPQATPAAINTGLSVPSPASVLLPSASTLLPSANMIPPSASTLPPSASTLLPSASTLPPSASTVPPSASTLPPSAKMIPPSANMVPPSDSVAPPSDSTVLPSVNVLPPPVNMTPSSANTIQPPVIMTPSSASTVPSSTSTTAGQSTTQVSYERQTAARVISLPRRQLQNDVSPKKSGRLPVRLPEVVSPPPRRTLVSPATYRKPRQSPRANRPQPTK
ncbi:MAG: type III secretion system outer membrane ring subunit SctC, partial [Pirellulales bacterium]|nr:type III secretion system outer membrane ring subunit SctC [Pirellulales bacterium]